MRSLRHYLPAFCGALTLVATTSVVHAAAPRSSDPDWPCAQQKVLKLTSTQIWDGPPTESITDWSEDEGVAKLVPTMVSRRVPTEQAIEALKKFAAATPVQDRAARLTKLFAGMLSTVNNERTTVMDGIERFQQRQRGRAQELEREGSRIAKLKETSATDPKVQSELEKAQELYDWNVRVFQERQSNTPIACEIPVIMESRIFELAREIRSLMPNGG